MFRPFVRSSCFGTGERGEDTEAAAIVLCHHAHYRTMPGFDDRTITLDAPEQLEKLGDVLGSRTRLAVLAVLVRADRPLHINEIARRVGVDASPVRTHLELLVRAGVARELDTPARERLFETSLTNVVLTLEGVNRANRPERGREPPKPVVRLQRKLEAMKRDIARIEEKARRVQDEIRKEWAKPSPGTSAPKT